MFPFNVENNNVVLKLMIIDNFAVAQTERLCTIEMNLYSMLNMVISHKLNRTFSLRS